VEKVNIEEFVYEMYEDELKILVSRKSEDLLNKICEYNKIEHLILSGKYKGIANKNFGYFEDVTDIIGNQLFYPNYKGSHQKLRIDRIFIPDPKNLVNGNVYHFKCELASKKERLKQDNPFLLQTTHKNVEESKIINDIAIATKNSETKLTELKDKIIQVQNDLKDNENIANATIEVFFQRMQKAEREIQSKGQELESLLETIETTKNQVKIMENLIRILKDRVSLCKNLQFISEDDESKYLNLLAPNEFHPINHHDFEKDFEKNFSKLSEYIHAYLYHKKNLIYTQYQIRNFLTLLKTHDIIVLSGLSGSGKTQIVKAFAEALGGVAKIIPVKPNWTSSDDLIGYYNPLQMSFLPTPFTEAIAEAINNPNQLYFICLDEMNLARAEYYFADFLSKLEDRSKSPEIQLYAYHEEELFISEFSNLLNLIETSIQGQKIQSWQDFLNNDVSRKKFFEMLGNTDKDSMLQLHSKMKRRLLDILKFPSTIKIPNNVRFIGSINVDETTHYFSPKILDRIHIVKFENPLLFEEQVNNWFENKKYEIELKPIYVHPYLLSERKEYPALNDSSFGYLVKTLKFINSNFLLPLNIDFGVRSIRQAINYDQQLVVFSSLENLDIGEVPEEEIVSLQIQKEYIVSLNSIMFQKIFPRFVFDGSETAKNGQSKMDVVIALQEFLSKELNGERFQYRLNEIDAGTDSSLYLKGMIEQAERNNSQFNFFA
jgi:energy-coupling factor transporter ATP-binding protein EcfA2